MIKKIVQFFTYILFSLLILTSIYSLINVDVLKKDYTNFFGYTYFVVSTGSMADAININDIIIVKLNDGYKQGDIITYKSGKSFITHRVVSINGNKIVAKGDANNAPDDPIKTKQVIGRVINHFSTNGILKLFGIILALFILVSIINFEKLFKKYVLREDNDDVEELLKELMKVKRSTKKSNAKDNYGEKEFAKFYDDVVKLLTVDSDEIELMSHDTRDKIKYIYRLCLLVKSKNYDELENVIDNPSFDEYYDYEFSKIDFTKRVENQLYVMPITSYLKIMLVAIIYDKDRFFDATYKVMKYKILVDKNKSFSKKYSALELDRVIDTIEAISLKKSIKLDKEKDYIKAKKDLDK